MTSGGTTKLLTFAGAVLFLLAALYFAGTSQTSADFMLYKGLAIISLAIGLIFAFGAFALRHERESEDPEEEY